MLAHTLYDINVTSSRIRNWFPQLTKVFIVQSPAFRASIQSQGSRAQRPESSIQSPASRVQHPGSSDQTPASRVQCPTLASRAQEFWYALLLRQTLVLVKSMTIVFSQNVSLWYIASSAAIKKLPAKRNVAFPYIFKWVTINIRFGSGLVDKIVDNIKLCNLELIFTQLSEVWRHVSFLYVIVLRLPKFDFFPDFYYYNFFSSGKSNIKHTLQ